MELYTRSCPTITQHPYASNTHTHFRQTGALCTDALRFQEINLHASSYPHARRSLGSAVSRFQMSRRIKGQMQSHKDEGGSVAEQTRSRTLGLNSLESYTWTRCEVIIPAFPLPDLTMGCTSFLLAGSGLVWGRWRDCHSFCGTICHPADSDCQCHCWSMAGKQTNKQKQHFFSSVKLKLS